MGDWRSREPDLTWSCLNPGHKSTEQVNNHVKCSVCGLTKEMTERFAASVLAQGQASLASMISDLDGWIERRAQEIAAPQVKAADERAGQRIAQFLTDASKRLQAKDDTAASLVRMNDALERQVARWRELAEGKAADMILRWDEVKAGDRALDGRLQVVNRIDEYDDHSGISVTGEDDRNWYLDVQPDALVAVRRSKEQADG